MVVMKCARIAPPFRPSFQPFHKSILLHAISHFSLYTVFHAIKTYWGKITSSNIIKHD